MKPSHPKDSGSGSESPAQPRLISGLLKAGAVFLLIKLVLVLVLNV